MNLRAIQPATRGCAACGPDYRRDTPLRGGLRSLAPAPAPIQRAAPPVRGHSLAAIRVTPPPRPAPASGRWEPGANAFAPIQLVNTPNKRLQKLQHRGIVTLVDRTNPGKIKTAPKRPKKAHKVHAYQARRYHVRKDADGRVVKISGPLSYTTTKRIATKKTANKRKDDVNFHLVPHFAGGPSDLKENYVAVNKLINSAGGDWGKMESYFRQRLKQKNTKAYMSVEPGYTGKKKRPDDVYATLKFNTSPYEVQFQVPTL